MSQRPRLLVGLPDSGLEPGLAGYAVASRGFGADANGAALHRPVATDSWGHGSAVARTVLAHSPAIRLLNAQVFDAHGVTTPAVVAAALDWLLEQGAGLINMSFGLRADRAVLRAACERALAAGVILVAAAPARGAAVYPASYPGVIRVTGDARCQAGEISHLDSVQADFGACPRAAGGAYSGPSGASLAVAQVCGRLAAMLMDDPACAKDPRRVLASVALYRGPEQRVG